MTGGFSRAIDLIQSDRGWDDQKVLELPLCRVRQLVELISQRKTEEFRATARVAEWQARNIASMFVALAESDKQAKAMSKMVEKMRLPLSDEENTSVDTRSIEEIIEQGALVDLDSQPSFEAISSRFNPPV